jgi:CO/xanthine dehydrogenase FAD-binding subunit
MRRSEIVQPETIQQAVRALQGRGAVAFAGGTDLIPAMQRGEARPQVLVNLKGLSDLRGIRRVRGGIRIGALTRVSEVLESALVAAEFPLLVAVARDFGSAQIRNLATIGGNLCNAAPSADLALPLLALDARLAIRGPGGSREIPVSEFFRGVNRPALARAEVLTAIIIPRAPARTGAAHAKLGIRQAMDLAFVSVAAALTLRTDGRKCRRVRIALGAVAPKPMRATMAEAKLEGEPLTLALLEEAAELAASECRPISDLRAGRDYRRKMTRVLVRRVLREALRRAQPARPQKEQSR